MALAAPSLLLRRRPGTVSETSKVPVHCAATHQRPARRKASRQKSAPSGKPSPRVDSTVPEELFQQRAELVRRQVQTALCRRNPEAALGHLTAFAQDIQDAAMPATPKQQTDSRHPTMLKATSQGHLSNSPMGVYRTETRNVIGDVFRGLPRHIMQVCVEQVWTGQYISVQACRS